MFAQVGIRKLAEAQGTILSTLTGVKGRGKSGLDTEQRSALEQAVEALEVRHGPPSAPLCFRFSLARIGSTMVVGLGAKNDAPRTHERKQGIAMVT